MERESERYQDRIHLYFEGQKKIIVQDNLTIISVQPQVFSFNAGDLLNYHKIFVDLIERWLFEIEALILVLAGFLSYFFAGLSMRTIEEKNERVKKILADVSHELKNPLSGIKLSLEISKKQESWERGELENFFSDLENEVKRLINITNDLLILEKAKNDDEVKELNLREVLGEVLKSLEKKIEEKNILVKKDVEDFYFQANREEMKKIFFNLIHNAIKFSKQNGRIDLFLDEGSFEIQDYGIGIKKKELKNIFKRFYKTDSSRRLEENSGSGLGLSIVKDLAEKYGIKIKVESEKGRGAKFILKF